MQISVNFFIPLYVFQFFLTFIWGGFWTLAITQAETRQGANNPSADVYFICGLACMFILGLISA